MVEHPTPTDRHLRNRDQVVEPSNAELGIDEGWRDANGEWCPADADTIALLRDRFSRSSNGGPGSGAHQPVRFVRSGTPTPLSHRGELTNEHGSSFGEVDVLPHDLPPGGYLLADSNGGPMTQLFVVPPRIERWPTDPSWGVVMQVATSLSDRSPTMGDLTSIRSVGDWVAERNGTALGVSPTNDMVPLAPRQNSPYSPSSRRFLDPLLIPMDRVQSDGPSHGRFEGGRARPDEIDRDAEWAWRRCQLVDRWDSLDPSERADMIDAAAQGVAQQPWSSDIAHAVFNAACEATRSPWTEWPTELTRADAAALRTFAHQHLSAVAWWTWVDQLADAEFREVRAHLANRRVDLIGDLPVGVASDGFDAWWDRDVLADGWQIGAPPDPFSPIGQNWGLPPMDPHLARSTGYRAFREVISANLGRVSALRIDHVMGLFRVFWIPPGADPTHGTYVRTPGSELIDLVVMHAVMAGCYIIGEDLGTVEDEVRHAMAERHIAGTRVAWFEHGHPDHWPQTSLATLTTHDLPTVCGALSGSDPATDPVMLDRLYAFAERGEGEDDDEVLVAAHHRLGSSNSTLALATLEDVVGSRLRVNLPGTVDQYPNWRLPLPVSVDELEEHPLALRVAHTISDARSQRHPDQ